MKLLAIAGVAALSACSHDRTVTPPAIVAALPTGAAWIAATPTLTTLAAAAKAAGVADTLAGPGPYTVFAPTDAAFARLAPGTVEALLKPENRAALGKLLTYHVVAGRITAADLTARVAAGNGTATLVTIEGDPLTLTMTQGHLTLTDVGGTRSYVEVGDAALANGIAHVVNGVLVPRLG